MVHAARQQRFSEVELERRHLAAESEPIEVVTRPTLLPFLQTRPGEHARRGAAVLWELALEDKALETDGVLSLDFNGRHGHNGRRTRTRARRSAGRATDGATRASARPRPKGRGGSSSGRHAQTYNTRDPGEGPSGQHPTKVSSLAPK